MHPFSTPLKTSEKLKERVKRERVEKGCIGNEWVKHTLDIVFRESSCTFTIYSRFLNIILLLLLLNGLLKSLSILNKKCYAFKQ